MARAIVTASISFGLVTIPVKVYTAAASEQISFNMITPDGNRVKQKLIDSVTGAEVTHDQCRKGYEVAKDQFVIFTADEIKALEAERDKSMQIKEFVSAASVDAVQVEKCYYLGPDKGGDKGYTLLAETMKATGKVAVAQWAARGKEQLVIIRPFKNGLILQQMYYAEEVRDFEEVAPAKVTVSDAEREMAAMLINALTTGEFDAHKYQDGYKKRVEEAVERKGNGLAVEAPTAMPKNNVMDMLAALKASLEQNQTGKK